MKLLNYYLPCLLAILSLSIVYGQDKELPAQCKDYTVSEQTLEGIQGKLDVLAESQKQKLQKKSSKNSKDVKEAYESIKDDLHYLDTACLLMSRGETIKVLDSILQRFTQSYPGIKEKKYRIFIKRSSQANASNVGAGIIYFNLGLISNLSTIDELAFVIAHELAHNELDHVNEGIIKRVQFLNDKEFQKKVKSIQRLDYYRNKSFKELMEHIQARFGEHSRANETSADSMGLVLLNKAGFSSQGAFSVLDILDSIDTRFMSEELDFEHLFSSPKIPFNKSWYDSNNSGLSLWSSKKIKEIPDSLKSHPDCKKRKEELQALQKKLRIQDKIPTALDYKFIKKVVLDYIEHLNHIERFDFSLFESLKYLKKFPENLFLRANVGNCLYNICRAQDEHTFSESVMHPSEYFPVQMNNLLTILNNISYTELLEISKNYVELNKEAFSSYTKFSAIPNKIKSLK